MKFSRLSLFLVIILSFIVAGCNNDNGGNNASGKGSSNLSIATNQPGFFYHTAGSAIANNITKNTDVNMTVRPYAGASIWLPLLNDNQVNFGITDAANINGAYEGLDEHSESPNLRTIISADQLVMSGYTVKEDSDIQSVSDLKGKKVAANYNGDWIIQKLLEAQLASVGLTREDVVEVPVPDVGAGLDALREGKVDAAFTGDPTQGVFLEVDNAIGLRALNLADLGPEDIDDFPEDIIDTMQDIIPFVEPVVANGGIIKEDTLVYKLPVTLASSDAISEEQAYETTKALWENYEQLHEGFGWFEIWTPETMFSETPPAPYHPGAIKYYKEIDVWTDEAEKNNEELKEKY